MNNRLNQLMRGIYDDMIGSIKEDTVASVKVTERDGDQLEVTIASREDDGVTQVGILIETSSFQTVVCHVSPEDIRAIADAFSNACFELGV